MHGGNTRNIRRPISFQPGGWILSNLQIQYDACTGARDSHWLYSVQMTRTKRAIGFEDRYPHLDEPLLIERESIRKHHLNSIAEIFDAVKVESIGRWVEYCCTQTIRVGSRAPGMCWPWRSTLCTVDRRVIRMSLRLRSLSQPER